MSPKNINLKYLNNNISILTHFKLHRCREFMMILPKNKEWSSE